MTLAQLDLLARGSHPRAPERQGTIADLRRMSEIANRGG